MTQFTNVSISIVSIIFPEAVDFVEGFDWGEFETVFVRDFFPCSPFFFRSLFCLDFDCSVDFSTDFLAFVRDLLILSSLCINNWGLVFTAELKDSPTESRIFSIHQYSAFCFLLSVWVEYRESLEKQFRFRKKKRKKVFEDSFKEVFFLSFLHNLKYVFFFLFP